MSEPVDSDDPDLLDQWLAYGESLLLRSRVTGSEYETTRIGLRPWADGTLPFYRRKVETPDPRAVKLMQRLDVAEKGPRA